ncbi:collagen-like triple helix repeat-containing protein [Nostoc sp.]|uniref:collagen-like triple helix repeat-containing protein n=1 Tax=Nostoc sp. TaxID=1180 RepID=UPI002FF5FD18
MSAISNLQQALNCAGKCDCCNKLESEIAALRAEIARIPRVNEAAIINTAKIQAKDLIMPLAISYVLSQLKPIQVLITGLENGLFRLSGQITNILTELSALELTIANALKTAASALGISNQALKAVGELFAKLAPILNIIGTILNLVAVIETLETLGGRIDAVERGLEALGASVSGILGKLLGLQNRISANEATIGQVRGIALDAKSIGEGAARIAGDAYTAAGVAEADAKTAHRKAVGAQTTADGAVRNAKQANDNATTAYQKAIEAQATANNATTIANNATTTANNATKEATKADNHAGQAFAKALEALGVALTALSLYQAFKGIRGLQGIPGTNGRNGRNGIDGAPGITTVVQIPGEPGAPGRDGAPGRPGVGVQGRPGTNGINGKPGTNGINGRNGIDVNPADVAGLRALIIQQHAGTRANVNATTTGLVSGVKAFFTGQVAAVTVLITTKAAEATKLITDIAKNTYVEKALSVLTFAATIHNGIMLSSNLGMTLETIINQVLGIILPKGFDGTPLNVGEIINKSVEELLTEAVGEKNYKTISQDWAIANRIYAATSNVFNSLTNFANMILMGLEVIGGTCGHIANALKKWGVVGDTAYQFFNPQPNFHNKALVFLETANADASTILNVVQVPIMVQAAQEQLNQSVTDLNKAIGQAEGAKPGISPAEAILEKAKADIEKNSSPAIFSVSANFLQSVDWISNDDGGGE